MHHRPLSLITTLAVLSFGCAGAKPVDIGENTPAKTGESLSDYAATWDGFLEDWTFASGSDRIRLTLDKDGNGTLEAGDDVDYGTPQADVLYAQPTYYAQERPFRTLYEGFKYTVLAANVADKRLQLGVDGYEIFSSWCPLETSYLEEPPPPPDPHNPIFFQMPMNPPGTYVCNDGTIDGTIDANSATFARPGGTCNLDHPDGSQTTVDCGQEIYCAFAGAPCTCTESGCSVVPESSGFENALDGALDNSNTFTGTLVFFDVTSGNQRVTVHLERQ
jgi:hypothetical protein